MERKDDIDFIPMRFTSNEVRAQRLYELLNAQIRDFSEFDESDHMKNFLHKISFGNFYDLYNLILTLEKKITSKDKKGLTKSQMVAFLKVMGICGNLRYFFEGGRDDEQTLSKVVKSYVEIYSYSPKSFLEIFALIELWDKVYKREDMLGWPDEVLSVGGGTYNALIAYETLRIFFLKKGKSENMPYIPKVITLETSKQFMDESLNMIRKKHPQILDAAIGGTVIGRYDEVSFSPKSFEMVDCSILDNFIGQPNVQKKIILNMINALKDDGYLQLIISNNFTDEFVSLLQEFGFEITDTYTKAYINRGYKGGYSSEIGPIYANLFDDHLNANRGIFFAIKRKDFDMKEFESRLSSINIFEKDNNGYGNLLKYFAVTDSSKLNVLNIAVDFLSNIINYENKNFDMLIKFISLIRSDGNIRENIDIILGNLFGKNGLTFLYKILIFESLFDCLDLESAYIITMIHDTENFMYSINVDISEDEFRAIEIIKKIFGDFQMDLPIWFRFDPRFSDFYFSNKYSDEDLISDSLLNFEIHDLFDEKKYQKSVHELESIIKIKNIYLEYTIGLIYETGDFNLAIMIVEFLYEHHNIGLFDKSILKTFLKEMLPNLSNDNKSYIAMIKELLQEIE